MHVVEQLFLYLQNPNLGDGIFVAFVVERNVTISKLSALLKLNIPIWNAIYGARCFSCVFHLMCKSPFGVALALTL